MPNDGGHLLLDAEARDALVATDPIAAKYVRVLLGADGMLDGTQRWCLWLVGAVPADLRGSSELHDRLARVQQYRLDSNRPATRKLAVTPSRFAEIRQPSSRYICVPRQPQSTCATSRWSTPSLRRSPTTPPSRSRPRINTPSVSCTRPCGWRGCGRSAAGSKATSGSRRRSPTTPSPGLTHPRPRSHARHRRSRGGAPSPRGTPIEHVGRPLRPARDAGRPRPGSRAARSRDRFPLRPRIVRRAIAPHRTPASLPRAHQSHGAPAPPTRRLDGR